MSSKFTAPVVALVATASLAFPARTALAATGVNPSPGGVYSLIVNQSGRCLRVVNDSKSNGALLQQWSCATSGYPKFRLRTTDQTHFNLIGINSGLCVEVPSSSTASGVQLQQSHCKIDQANQLWTFAPSGTTTYQLKNVASNLCLADKNASLINGAAIIQETCATKASQQLAFTPAADERTWSDTADGFAALASQSQNGTTGGLGGATVTVTTMEDLVQYATAAEPYIIRVAGPITITPKGTEIRVTSNKTIVGVGLSGEIIQGGFFLNQGVHNVIIRNLTIRDTYVEGDPDGKCCDWDAIQMDNAHHVWIDHNHLTRMNDGLIDSRKDTTNVTVSWNILSNHNKAFGIGWTPNVLAELTIHHNWIADTTQRNPSCDNALHAHLYNNFMQNIGAYGNYARGSTNMVIENSYFDSVIDPYYPDPTTAQLVQRGSIVVNSSGKKITAGTAFTPSDFYSYTLDSAANVPALLRRFAGPQASIGQ